MKEFAVGAIGGALGATLIALVGLYFPQTGSGHVDRYAALMGSLVVYGPIAFVLGAIAANFGLRWYETRQRVWKRRTAIAASLLVALLLFVGLYVVRGE